MFQLLSIDDILTLYTALMSEEKRIFVVSDNTADLVPVIHTLLSFMYPFEPSLPVEPMKWSPDVDNDNIITGMTGKIFD